MTHTDKSPPESVLRGQFTDKYRPRQISDVKGQEHVKTTLAECVAAQTIPHCLFIGPSGTGKTSMAHAVAAELLGDDWESQFLDLNASEERGIDDVRTTIQEFAGRHAADVPFRIIFLDESDSMTDQAQNALRRLMEDFTHNARFILSVNYPSDVIDAIHSRCMPFRFSPLDSTHISTHLTQVAAAENVSLTDDAAQTLGRLADGDMRRALHLLQAAIAHNLADTEQPTGQNNTDKTSEDSTNQQHSAVTITTSRVYAVAPTAPPELVTNLLTDLEAGDTQTARERLTHAVRNEGVMPDEIVQAMYHALWNDTLDLEFTDDTKLEATNALADTEHRLSYGADGLIQLAALLSTLQPIIELKQ